MPVGSGPGVMEPNRGWVHKFGNNGDVDAAEDIHAAGGEYPGHPVPWAAEVLTVESDNVNDTDGGSGASSVEVYGLDASGLEQSAVATLNGTSAVPLDGTWVRSNRAIVRSANTNTGTLSVIGVTSGLVYATVSPSEGQTHIAAYTVPSNRGGYVRHITCSLGGVSDREAVVHLLVRPLGESWQIKYPADVTTSSPLDLEIKGGIWVPPSADVKLRIASVGSVNTVVHGHFSVALFAD